MPEVTPFPARRTTPEEAGNLAAAMARGLAMRLFPGLPGSTPEDCRRACAIEHEAMTEAEGVLQGIAGRVGTAEASRLAFEVQAHLAATFAKAEAFTAVADADEAAARTA